MKSSSSSRVLSCAVLLLLAMLPALSGCASTKVREVWRDEAFQGHPKSVLVVAVMKNLTVQRQFESEFAKRFKERGISAVESFRVLPDGVVLEGDAGREAIVAAIKSQGIDAVLLTRVTGRRTKSEEIPGMTITAGYGYPYAGAGAWGGYAGVGYTFGGPSKPTTQGYSHETVFLDIETHLFDAKAEKLIWGARSETRVAGPPQEQIVPYVENVCRILLHEPFLR